MNDQEKLLNSLKLKRHDFIENNLKGLEGWNLLSEEEKQSFYDQINNLQPDQFEIVLEQAKKKIKEKKPTESEELENRQIPFLPPFNGNGKDGELPENTQENPVSPVLTLVKSQAKAEQEVEKLLKDNAITEQELAQLAKTIFPGQSNWKDYLKSLDTPAKVSEFTAKMQQAILKMRLKSQATPQDQKPDSGWVLPVIIVVVSLLALTSLILIVRKRRQRRF